MNSKNVSFLLPTLNEKKSLIKTVKIIFRNCDKHIKEILIITSKKTNINTLNIIKNIKKKYKNIKIIVQTLPGLGGAYKSGIKAAKGKYTIIMSTDLETNPETCIRLINKIKKENTDVVLASRWLKKNSFDNYGKFKILLNYFFQKIISYLYNTNLTDLSHCFGIRKTKILKSTICKHNDHSYMLEIVLRILKKNYKHSEVYTKMISRSEGTSNKNFKDYFNYLFIALKVYILK